MQDFPLEIITALLSFTVLGAIILKYFEYKKILNVLKELSKLKDSKKLSAEDREYISTNLKEYKAKLEYRTSFNKLMYPLFIIVVAAFVLLFTFQEAITHSNIVVVSFVYITIIKIHTNNIVSFLEELNS